MEDYQGLDFETVKQAIAQHCSFSLSKELVLEVLPQYSYLYAKRDNDRGRSALHLLEHQGSPSFGGVQDLYDVFKAAKKGKQLSIQELIDIYNMMQATSAMDTYRKSWEIEEEIIDDFISSLIFHKQEAQAIEHAIHVNNGEMKDDASSELASIRRQIKSCESEITRKTNELLQKYASSLMDNIIAYRGGRACLLVKSGDKHKIKGFIHDESASGQAVYIEPEVLLVLNNKLQSLLANEKNEIERILKDLSSKIEVICDELEANLETLTLLDSLFAKAKWANKVGAIYADLSDKQDSLYFKYARHPLIDEDKVVSNTYELEAPYRQLIISGSNTGGKTVTLKTIGLFSLMSLSGFPVSCEEARVPVFDGIFVDVGDFQSILESLSTFSAHLSSLSKILDKASEHSLVLLDELGSGTDPQEGECLAIAILEYLREHHIMSVVTTHYAKVKEYAKTNDTMLLSSVGFNMETMEPTYKYMSGFSGNSNALEIAKRYHIKEEILTYANKLKEQQYSEADRLLEKLEEDRLELLRAQETLEQQQKELKESQELLDKQSKQLQEDTIKQVDKAKSEAHDILEDAKVKAKEVIRELKSMKSVKDHEIIESVSKLKQEESEEPISVEETFVVGDYVQVIGLQYHGEIISIKGNRVSVLCNGVKMNVKTHEITHTTRPKVFKNVSITSKQTSKRPSMECNVIGMRVDEAIPVVRKYLDNALVNKMYIVRIVHGSGTGALRSAIHEFLKKQPNVKEFRLGGEGEGGLGATVVNLKGKQ